MRGIKELPMSHFTFDQDVHPAAIPSELYLPLPLHSKSNPVRNQRTSRFGKAKTKHRKAVSEGQASLFPSRICQSGGNAMTEHLTHEKSMNNSEMVD